jgi:hypothetical protein
MMMMMLALMMMMMMMQIHYGHSVLWGYHEHLPPGEPYIYIVMTREPLARRVSDYIFQKEQRHVRSFSMALEGASAPRCSRLVRVPIRLAGWSVESG